MNNENWTPGPWKAHFNSYQNAWEVGMGSYLENPNEYYCSELWVCEESDDTAKANARLIAAAPELYEALKKARTLIQATIEDGYIGNISFRTEVDEALAKARGEQ